MSLRLSGFRNIGNRPERLSASKLLIWRGSASFSLFGFRNRTGRAVRYPLFTIDLALLSFNTVICVQCFPRSCCTCRSLIRLSKDKGKQQLFRLRWRRGSGVRDIVAVFRCIPVLPPSTCRQICRDRSQVRSKQRGRSFLFRSGSSQ